MYADHVINSSLILFICAISIISVISGEILYISQTTNLSGIISPQLLHVGGNQWKPL